MQAYVHKKTKNPLNRETALAGLSERGHIVDIVNDISEVPDNLYDCIFYGNIGFIRDVVNKLGYTQCYIGHVPDELQSLAGRYIKRVSIDEAVAESKLNSIFIKPVPENNKQFTGFVMDKGQLNAIYYINYILNGYDQVLMSPEVKFVSEWRCFVLGKECLDAKHYYGDFRLCPDYSVVDNAIKMWKSAPIAWSCDLGITDKGETFIVECNDVMSLGFYGLVSYKAGAILEERWQEIHRNKSL